MTPAALRARYLATHLQLWAEIHGNTECPLVQPVRPTVGPQANTEQRGETSLRPPWNYVGRAHWALQEKEFSGGPL